MKLFLSSYHVGNCANRLRELVGSNRKALIIPNAGDLWDAYRQNNFPQILADLKKLGTDAEELDLRSYFGNADRLKNVVSRAGLLWVTGGNTFVLRRAMKESGLDLLLPEILRNSDCVYGGFSAGACVTSPSLKGIHLADEPEAVPEDYPTKEVIWNGLGLVDFYIVPHYRSKHSESAMMESVVASYQGGNLPFYTLSDGEALVVDGKKVLKCG